MNKNQKQESLSKAPTNQSAPYQELGAYLESLRRTRPYEGRKLSIHRLTHLAEMSNSTYAHIKKGAV